MKISTETDSGNLKNKTDEINYITYKSREYELKDIDGKKFITVKSNNNRAIFDFVQCHKSININTYDLVNSIIKLAEKMPKSKYYGILAVSSIDNNKVFELLEAELQDKHIKMIIKWCEKYGLPFVGESGIKAGKVKEYKWFGFENDMETCEKYDICGFRIGGFLIGINVILKTARYSGEIKEINRIKANRTGERKEEERKIEERKELYENYLYKSTRAARFHYEMIENKEIMMYDIKLYADTLLSAAMYTLQMWACSPDYYTIKRCRLCLRHFVTKDTRNLYCNNPCNKDMFNKRKVRGKALKKKPINDSKKKYKEKN